MEENRFLEPEHWITNYRGFLKSYAFKKLPEHIIEDIIQETFLSALKSASLYKGSATERTWLVSILRNKIVDYYRTLSTKKALTHEMAIKSENFNDYTCVKLNHYKLDSSNPETYITLNDLAQVLEKGLCSLPEKESKALKFKIEGMNTCQICAKMNINRDYCWILISRARNKLKIFLRENWAK